VDIDEAGEDSDEDGKDTGNVLGPGNKEVTGNVDIDEADEDSDKDGKDTGNENGPGNKEVAGYEDECLELFKAAVDGVARRRLKAMRENDKLTKEAEALYMSLGDEWGRYFRKVAYKNAELGNENQERRDENQQLRD